MVSKINVMNIAYQYCSISVNSLHKLYVDGNKYLHIIDFFHISYKYTVSILKDWDRGMFAR